MKRRNMFSASTALVLSLIIGLSLPAFADRHEGDGKARHAERVSEHANMRAERQASRAAARAQVNELRAHNMEMRNSVRAERNAARIEQRNTAAQQRLQNQQLRASERANISAQRLQVRQTNLENRATLNQQRSANRLKLDEQHASEQLRLQQTRDTARLQTQQNRFDRQLSNQQFRAKEQAQRQQFAAQLQTARQENRLQLQRLRQENRLASYRLQADYFDRLERQRLSLVNGRDLFLVNRPAYYSNPGFYTTPFYGYYRNGSYLTTSRYGGSLLEQAVNQGCQQGFAAGIADHQDRFGFYPTNSLIYQDANLGYSGLFVPRSDYNYYFRKGYSNCYRDGYYGRSNSASGIVNSVLNSVLGLQYLR